ncbi:zinc dependent phospholipase C family protein [Lewinella sp. W8]|uniref:zinc dependent phospholipase C family protein n=1 Tax=Lewinella sp. W8 TaxID=2528208 RepID=UPI001068B2B8|nr:zinc dependent phospholipase C family protein [Lewinella sp. W8]MTB50498.1 hypothetical protein [Lewinella sp. W8]
MGSAFTTIPTPEWGFFGHRRINRLAVFTLDAEMMPFFRAHLEWVTEHAVDPDKRRYATEHEAVRHYIDLDHWSEDKTYDHVPERWTDALIWKAGLTIGSENWKVDTILQAPGNQKFSPESVVVFNNDRSRVEIPLGTCRGWWIRNVIPQYYEDQIVVPADSARALGLPAISAQEVTISEGFTDYGILPYHLESMHRRLTEAFREENPTKILRLAAEMGHYIGDAHVPLHTTENYNGQLTDQVGIHAFWESRLPELFADEEYDFFVGKATYIENPREYYWDIVMDSHVLVDSVLQSEWRLRQTFPEDQQMCFDERLGRTIRTQCPEFARAWATVMQGMVEERFRASILSVGSVWYSCWIDAGQPDLSRLVPNLANAETVDSLNAAVQRGKIKGRVHE